MATALIGLGSNLDDRAGALDAAVAMLNAQEGVELVRRSQSRAYPGIGGPPEQPAYLNAAATIRTQLSPQALLRAMQRIEAQLGRTRDVRWGPRTIDLDLLLYDDQTLDTPSLIVPHPRLAVRRFVLEPAAEIAPEMTHPVNGWSLARLLENLENGPHAISLCGPLAERLQRACSAAPTPLVLGPRLDVDLLFIAGRDPFAETFRRRADAPPSLSLPNADFETCRTELLAAIAAME